MTRVFLEEKIDKNESETRELWKFSLMQEWNYHSSDNSLDKKTKKKNLCNCARALMRQLVEQRRRNNTRPNFLWLAAKYLKQIENFRIICKIKRIFLQLCKKNF